MGQNNREDKLLSHDLRNAFRKAKSRVNNAKISVRPRSLQCWAIKRSTFLGIILSLIFAIPAFPQANGPSAFSAASAATATDPSLAAFASSQRRSLAAPVAKQVALLTALKLHQARAEGRGGACCAEGRRPIRLWKCWDGEYQGHDDAEKRTPLECPTLARARMNRDLCIADPQCCFSECISETMR